MRSLVLIVHNVRSAHNVGSILRTADGLGIDQVFLTGYTPYPQHEKDQRLPHLSKKIDSQIHKTALGAESTVDWRHEASVKTVIDTLCQKGFQIIGLEQSPSAVSLTKFQVPNKLAVIVGREVEGIEPEILDLCDKIVEIPMQGKKESFNVVVAAAIFLSYCQFS